MRTYFSLFITAVWLFSAGCGDSTTDQAAEFIASGWEKFEAHDYTGAAEDFANAIDADSSKAEAYVGLGWTALKMDQLIIADLAFAYAIELEPSDDAYAGKAFADFNLENHVAAAADVDEVVTIAENAANAYTFSHDPSITQTDLLWIKARAHFLMGQYAGAQTVLNVLSPSNGLNPESSSYIQDLADAIENLRLTV